jgi:hypothetical protein
MPLKPREFLTLVVDTAIALQPEKPNVRVRASLAQLSYDAPDQHYEVWLRQRAGLLELGLHFEGPREENLRRLAVVADAMPEILESLGDGPELEEWTESWTRLHEVHPMETLDETFAREIGERLAAYVTTLQPILRPLGPMPRPVRGEHTGRWRGRRHGTARVSKP